MEKDLFEIKKMMKVGNKFDILIQELENGRFSVIFTLMSNASTQFILCTQRRNDRPFKTRQFRTLDAAVKVIKGLGFQCMTIKCFLEQKT